MVQTFNVFNYRMVFINVNFKITILDIAGCMTYVSLQYTAESSSYCDIYVKVQDNSNETLRVLLNGNTKRSLLINNAL